MKRSTTGVPQLFDRPAPRREFLKSGIAAAAALGLESSLTPAKLAFGARRAVRGLTVERIERVTVKVPYREVPERAMDRELPHWRYAEIFEVHLRSRHVGFGETLLYYTWGVTDADDVARTIGQNAASFMWDDSLGAGLQMALFDAVARTLGVPIHRLLGRQKYETTPLSWWNIDMPPADVAAECAEALRTGYLSYKTKGRPWFDLWDQVEQACNVVPESFKVDMDFNDTLLDAEHAIPILKELEQYPQIDIYETPIPQSDIAGNQAIRAATRVNIAMHYGNPDPAIALKEEICDGFVVGGGASSVMEQGAVAAMADKPFWLQLVGTGLTAAFSLHFGAVLSHARWPAVNCHQLYTHPMLTEPIQVKEGSADVPIKPGLGYDVDAAAIEQFRVKKPSRRPDPPRLIETTWPDGRKMFIANNGQVNFMHGPAKQGKYPFYERGVTTRLVPNDGSDQWRQLYNQARKAPLMKSE
jgi:galactonate dehydratase